MTSITPPQPNGAELVLRQVVNDFTIAQNITIPKASQYDWCKVSVQINKADSLAIVSQIIRFNTDSSAKYTWIEDLNIAGVRTNPAVIVATTGILNTNIADASGGAGGNTSMDIVFPLTRATVFSLFSMDTWASNTPGTIRRSQIIGMYQGIPPITQINLGSLGGAVSNGVIDVLCWGK